MMTVDNERWVPSVTESIKSWFDCIFKTFLLFPKGRSRYHCQSVTISPFSAGTWGHMVIKRIVVLMVMIRMGLVFVTIRVMTMVRLVTPIVLCGVMMARMVVVIVSVDVLGIQWSVVGLFVVPVLERIRSTTPGFRSVPPQVLTSSQQILLSLTELFSIS